MNHGGKGCAALELEGGLQVEKYPPSPWNGQCKAAKDANEVLPDLQKCAEILRWEDDEGDIDFGEAGSG